MKNLDRVEFADAFIFQDRRERRNIRQRAREIFYKETKTDRRLDRARYMYTAREVERDTEADRRLAREKDIIHKE